MREIKFRGLNKHNVWVYGDLLQKMNPKIIVSYGTLERDNDYTENNIIDGTECQFTGLQDKNGIDIYEGDIVKVLNKGYNVSKSSIVTWGKKSHGWSIKCSIDDKWIKVKYYGLGNSKDIEIIGNIYQNPELLK